MYAFVQFLEYIKYRLFHIEVKIVYVVFRIDCVHQLADFFVKVVLVYVLSHDRVQRIPELVGDAGVDQTEEVVLGLDLIVEDAVADVHDLEYYHGFIVSFHFASLDLHVADVRITLAIIGIFLETASAVILELEEHLTAHHVIVLSKEDGVLDLLLLEFEDVVQAELRRLRLVLVDYLQFFLLLLLQ